jgi:hypothetical protein
LWDFNGLERASNHGRHEAGAADAGARPHVPIAGDLAIDLQVDLEDTGKIWMIHNR